MKNSAKGNNGKKEPSHSYISADAMLDRAQKELQSLVWQKARARYGERLPKLVEDRIEKELHAIISNKFACIFMAAQKLVAHSEAHGYLVGFRGSIGASLAAHLSGISVVNPLPPHYICDNCKCSEFFTIDEYGSGFDMPEKTCPHCDAVLSRDGHEIPVETLLGFDMDKKPDIVLNLSADLQSTAHEYIVELFGDDNVFVTRTGGAHFKLHASSDTFYKIDILPHNMPTMYRYLEEYSGVSVREVPLCEEKVISLFTSTAALGVSPCDVKAQTGTLGLASAETELACQIFVEAQPKCFSDLVQVLGLSHGTNVWQHNAQDLIRDGVCDISQVIALRDSIMLYLIRKGLNPQLAYEIMEAVRRGKGLSETDSYIMSKHGIKKWYIESCNKTGYLFPKAHVTAYMMEACRLAWYKLYKPLAFYAASFTMRSDYFDTATVINGAAAIKDRLIKLNAAIGEESFGYDEISTLKLANEMIQRGFKFLPADREKSDRMKFSIENGKIRLPLSVLPEQDR